MNRLNERAASRSPTRRRLLGAGAAAAIANPWLTARAQSGPWPSRPVTFVVPFPSGGGTDAFARPLTAGLTRSLGKQVIIDNRGGAGGNVGATVASKAAPDGYTFFMGAVHHAIAPSMYPKLDYNLEADFIPVGLISSVPQVIVVNPQRVASRTLPELLAFVRANPGKLNYGSAGNGSAGHLAMEYLKLVTGMFITHIPYRGTGPQLTDLLAGRTEASSAGDRAWWACSRSPRKTSRVGLVAWIRSVRRCKLRWVVPPGTGTPLRRKACALPKWASATSNKPCSGR